MLSYEIRDIKVLKSVDLAVFIAGRDNKFGMFIFQGKVSIRFLMHRDGHGWTIC